MRAARTAGARATDVTHSPFEKKKKETEIFQSAPLFLARDRAAGSRRGLPCAEDVFADVLFSSYGNF